MKTNNRNIEDMLNQEKPNAISRAASGLYAFGWNCYASWYKMGLKKAVKPDCPIICIGNLTVGGTGKSPTIIAIVKLLQKQNIRPAALATGYGGKRYHQVTLLDPGISQPADEIGDEALMLRELLPDIPIAVGKWRVKTSTSAYLTWKPDVILSDDGFQHLPLSRTADIVLLDGTKPFGNGFVLPAGTLREPVSGLKRATAVIFTSQPEESSLRSVKEIAPELPIFTAIKQADGYLNTRTGERCNQLPPSESGIIALSGIGNPESFETLLKDDGQNIVKAIRMADHHAYNQADLQLIEQAVEETGAETLVTTAKDYVKLRDLLSDWKLPTYTLNLQMKIEPEMEFTQLLVSLINNSG